MKAIGFLYWLFFRQQDGATPDYSICILFKWGGQLILTAGIVVFQNHQLTVAGRTHFLKLFDGEVEPAHDKQADGQRMGNEYTILREVGTAEVSVQGS